MLIIKLIKKEEITEKEIENELYEICDRVHASCDSDCPVYFLNNYMKFMTKNSGCDCFKNGKSMRLFIEKHI